MRPFPIDFKKERVAIVAHDAGGANQIAAFLKRIPCRKSIAVYAEGPALRIWKSELPELNFLSSLENALENADIIVTGSGWQSDLEYKAIKSARLKSLRTITVLDHWANYIDRFIRNAELVLPSEIVVVDEYAAIDAKKSFPKLKISQIQDFYLMDCLAQIGPPDSSKKPSLLHIAEPIRLNWGINEPGEFQVLRYLVRNLQKLSIPADTAIKIRPHPSERPEKYTNWLENQSMPSVQVDFGQPLSDAITTATWVSGCESYALVVAAASGRDAFSALPPWANKCRLPHPSIIRLQDFIK